MGNPSDEKLPSPPSPLKPDFKKITRSREIWKRKLFVGMLSKKCTENEVRIMFAPYGTIEECTVLRDANGQSRGCAFVTYSSRQCAINAIKAMHQSQTMEGCTSPMVVKFADTPKEKDQKRMQQMSALWNISNINLNTLTPQYLALLQQAAAAGSPTIFGSTPQVSTLNSLLGLQSLTGQNLAGLTLQNSVGNTTELNAANLQSLAALASIASSANPGSLSPMNLQNLASLAAAVSSSNSNLPGISTSGSLPSTTSTGSMTLGGLGGLSSVNSLGLSNSSLASMAAGMQGMNGLASATNPTGSASATNGPSLDALTQAAYSGLQQYTGNVTAFPNAFATQSTGIPQSPSPAGPEGSNLFIYHLPQEFSDNDLAQTFSPFGNVISAKVFIDKQTNLSKCFGFVSYDNPMSAQSAIQSMNGFQIGMKRLKVQLKRSKDKPY